MIKKNKNLLFKKLNQITILSNPTRFKILLALYTSDILFKKRRRTKMRKQTYRRRRRDCETCKTKRRVNQNDECIHCKNGKEIKK